MPLTQHEPRDQLPELVLNQRRALETVIEELEAVAWYNERGAACSDPELKAVIEHNRNEEIEHAMMGLEWLRRNFPEFNENMSTYLFQSAPITELEGLAEGEGDSDEGGTGSADADAGSLGIGSLKKNK